MIDLEGLPVPAEAPAPGSCVRVERPEAGLALLFLDPPHRRMAVFDVPLLRDLDRALDELAQDASLRGLVITGREPLSFAAGADVDSIAKVTDPELATKFARSGQALFQRLHRLSRSGGGRLFVVAAVGGPVPGGACEIALACDRIVLADHPKSRIGLPEVLLGIIPAWGGSQRLPRRIGVAAALGAILTGKLHVPRQALALGLVDRLTPPEYLVRVASDVALGRSPCAYRGRTGVRKVLLDRNPLVTALIASQARKKVLAETRGNYPAPLAVIPLVAGAPRRALEAGLAAEAEAVRPLCTGSVSSALLGLFQLSEEAKKTANQGEKKAAALERAAVIGAGIMGGGIASLLAERGLAVRLRDLDRKQLDAAVVAHQAEIEKKRKRKQLARHEADAALDRLTATTEPTGFARCQIAIEAVAERLEVKRAVLRELAAQMGDEAILATNTSSLSVGQIAEGLPNPARVVGMHFFNPPRKMPLVEIVRGPRTSDDVVRRTARLALDLGKTPVVTKDVAGFLVNRVLGPYLDEALRLVGAGVDPEAIDRALVGFGMPMGPCELVDEVGLDIATHAGASLQQAYGERMQATALLQPLVEQKELGKKSGRGLFVWQKGKGDRPAKAGVNPRLAHAARRTMDAAELVDRCVLAMANEAVRCLTEGVVDGPRALDLATVFGTGFAPFRGGVLRYADSLGLSKVVERLEHLRGTIQGEHERLGRYEPAPLLVDLARAGGKLHG